MSKFAVAICVLFVALCVVEARKCYYIPTGGICQGQCCGKEDDMYCLNSCENVSCSSHDDCGRGCCRNEKCGPPTNSEKCDNSDAIIALVVALVCAGVVATVAALIMYFCRLRKKSSVTPGMRIILVNHDVLNSNNN